MPNRLGGDVRVAIDLLVEHLDQLVRVADRESLDARYLESLRFQYAALRQLAATTTSHRDHSLVTAVSITLPSTLKSLVSHAALDDELQRCHQELGRLQEAMRNSDLGA